MNQTLEAMARALFKSWFVNFEPVRAKAAGREVATKQNGIVAIDQFKEQIIHFKLNHEAMDNDELGRWLKANIKAITLKGADADILFMLLDL